MLKQTLIMRGKIKFILWVFHSKKAEKSKSLFQTPEDTRSKVALLYSSYI